jgi:hypothetical protein
VGFRFEEEVDFAGIRKLNSQRSHSDLRGAKRGLTKARKTISGSIHFSSEGSLGFSLGAACGA